MSRLLRPVLLALGLILGGWLPAHAESNPPLPAAYFPPESWIDYHPAVSNADMDQWWGRDGNGYPMMHALSQDILSRTSGWLESSFRRVGNDYIYFAIFQSEYGRLRDGSAANIAAFTDWQKAVADINGLALARNQPKEMLPAGTDGHAETRVLSAAEGGPSVTVAAWWGATHEVEALGIYSGKLMTVQRVQRMLAAQVRFVIGSGA